MRNCIFKLYEEEGFVDCIIDSNNCLPKLLSNGIMVVIEECCLRKKPSIRLNDVKNASEEITIYMRITEIIRV